MLEVPLDYADAKAGTTTIAFIKTVSPNKDAKDILVNPGGPGGSGIDMVRGSYKEYLPLISGDPNKTTDYNLVGFDPRGIGYSGPTLSCYNSTAGDAARLETATEATYGELMPIEAVYQLSQARGEFCTKANKDTDAKYVGTVAVANDMLHYIKIAAEANGKKADDAKLMYWGVSYGTVIGATFARLFPDKVERIVVDGNVDSVQYYTGHAVNAVADADHCFRTFFKHCFEAGAELCPFAGNTTSAIDLEARYVKMWENLKRFPMVVSDPEVVPIPTLLTMSQLMKPIMTAFRNPAAYPLLGQLLALIDSGANATTIYKAINSTPIFASTPESKAAESIMAEKGVLITCIDSNPQFRLPREELLGVQAYYNGTSRFFGEDVFRANGLACPGFDISPPPSQIFPGLETTNTSFPILFIGTTADPITPLSNAHNIAKFFPGSVVLAQNSPGHGFTAAGSRCTVKAFGEYLREGKLPPTGTICELDEPLFQKPKDESTA